MDIKNTIIALSALAQESRLKLFKLLIEYGQEGMPAGFIGEKLRIPHNTLSFHLAHLKRAGLVTSRRRGRSIIYAANLKATEKLIDSLVEKCCARAQDSDCALNTQPGCAPVRKSTKKSKASCC
jgi:ArsR family transcriptional regulator, arsenate/arsenite/antimonite-responsive transcriptional repressor